MITTEDAERVLDADNWKLEAQAVINDIKKHVKDVLILEGTDTHVYFNLTTLESKQYCIELSSNGFRVVGTAFNQKDWDNDQYFETPYSLLNHISPQFNQSFGNELIDKLKHLDNV